MIRSLRVGAAAAVSIVVATAVASWLGAESQERKLAADIDRLIDAGQSVRLAPYPAPQELDQLPPAVSRYLRWAVPSGTHIAEVRLGQHGTLRTDTQSSRWMPFEADHVVVPPATGFVWNARVAIAPFLHVRVRDALIDGRGAGQVSLMSTFIVGADAGTTEMNSGSLHRYLAEAVWYPTALLPAPHLRWTAIDSTTALATLNNNGLTVSLQFRFSDSGEVTGIYTPARWGSFEGGYRQLPWEGHFRDYRKRDGIQVPTEGEVGWYVADRWEAVWRGTVTTFTVTSRK